MRVFYSDFNVTGHHVEYLAHLLEGGATFNFIGSCALWELALRRSGLRAIAGEHILFEIGTTSVNYSRIRSLLYSYPDVLVYLLHWDEYRSRIFFSLFKDPYVVTRISGIVFRNEIFRCRFSLIGFLDWIILPALIRCLTRASLGFLDPRCLEYLGNVRYIPDPVGVPILKVGNKKIYDVLFIGKHTSRKNTLWALRALEQVHFDGRIGVLGELDCSRAAIDVLRDRLNIVVIDRVLSDAEFVEALLLARIVCIPYRKWYGSSGLLVNSAALGVPVLAVNKGQISDEVRRFQLGELYEEHSENDFLKKIFQMLRSSNPKSNLQVCASEHFIRSRSSHAFATAVHCSAWGHPPVLIT